MQPFWDKQADMGKIFRNFAPADVKKEGSGFDLPLAIGQLAAVSNVLTDYKGIDSNLDRSTWGE